MVVSISIHWTSHFWGVEYSVRVADNHELVISGNCSKLHGGNSTHIIQNGYRLEIYADTYDLTCANEARMTNVGWKQDGVNSHFIDCTHKYLITNEKLVG